MFKKPGIVLPDNKSHTAHSQMKMVLSVLRLDMSISFIVLKDLFQKLFSSSFPIILAVWEKWSPSLQLVAAVFLILETSLQPLCYVSLSYNVCP